MAFYHHFIDCPVICVGSPLILIILRNNKSWKTTRRRVGPNLSFFKPLLDLAFDLDTFHVCGVIKRLIWQLITWNKLDGMLYCLHGQGRFGLFKNINIGIQK